MTQEPYLLVVEESSGGNSFITRHVIKAEDRQKVKYHFHRTLKDWGYNDTPYGKHCLEGPHQMLSEICDIRRLKPEEYDVMDKFLSSWVKV